ncbi:serine hydroxymethyltransferase [Sphaerotilaceae bacterium SBD11-9]
MYYNHLSKIDPAIARLMRGEELRQITGLELIASENYVSPAVMEAMGSVLNNRYSEGYPGRRYYGGQEFTDQIEQIAIDRAKALFGCEYANVQPHAGAPANIATYFALAEPGSTILGMELAHGGHLTHGHPITHVAKIFNFVRYGMSDVGTGRIDYDEMRAVARRTRPKIILAGFSAYPRELDYAVMREIATEVGAWAVADVAHIAGMIVGKQLANPFDAGFDVVLTTTHKSLRGPRGGMILSREASTAKLIDKSVFPAFQGGPIMQMIAAKAVAFEEAGRPEFKDYARQIIVNSRALAESLMARGARLVTNGTDNHLMLVDSVSSWGISGGVAEKRLDEVGITVNKNMIPNERRSAMDPSGIRIGTPALTTRGLKEAEMVLLGELVDRTLSANDDTSPPEIRAEVLSFARRFPVPGIALNDGS